MMIMLYTILAIVAMTAFSLGMCGLMVIIGVVPVIQSLVKRGVLNEQNPIVAYLYNLI